MNWVVLAALILGFSVWRQTRMLCSSEHPIYGRCRLNPGHPLRVPHVGRWGETWR